jgi:hypothetical protein
MFGLDGFEDLYEWTVVSIDECLGNRHIGRVLVKEHPNIDLATFPGDKHAVERLRTRYHQESKLKYIDRRTDIKALRSLGLLYGITNHGSVAEELVAVGLPVIASSKGPWGKGYPFLHLWHSPEEYIAVLRGLTFSEWSPPGQAEQDALARFVTEYRMTVLPGQELPVSVQWMLWENRNIDILSCDISTEAERRIAELEPDSVSLVDWLRKRARLYRIVSDAGLTVEQEDPLRARRVAF